MNEPAQAATTPQPMSGPLLVVEDDPVTARLLEKTLAALGRPVQLAGSAEEAREAIALAPPSLILLDLVLPDADGRQLLETWRSSPVTAHVPVLVMTVSATPEIREQCLALGAAAFVEKPLDVAAVTETAQGLLEQEPAAVDAGHDPLTGVASRAALTHAFRRLARDRGAEEPLAVAMIGLDRFRAVNDSCGRETGDRVLRGVADLIRTSTAGGQVVGRWGGDRFMAMLPGVTEEEATNWLDRCLEALRRHAFSSTQGARFSVTFSAGVIAAEPGAGLDDVVSAVLDRLYLAKESGRGRVVSGDTEVESSGATILLADDDDVVAAVVQSTLEAQGFSVERFRNGAAALAATEDRSFDLFLLDINMPQMDGFELLALLRARQAYARVPVAMLTSVGDEDSVERAMALGADDYLVKPLSSHALTAHVRHLLSRWVEGRLHELQGSELYVRGIELLQRVFDNVRAGEKLPVKDLSLLTLRIVADLKSRPATLLGQVMNPTVLHEDYLAQHSLNSAILATIVGQEVGVEGDDLDWLFVAGLLHEVGCVRLPEGLLQKTGDLTAEERELLQRRPELGHEIICELAPEYAEAAEIALQVHERPDGSGYPKGLTDEQISLEAQILGAVEVFEALTHHRPYRDSPQAASEAVKYLLDASDTHFRDLVLKALIAKIGLYPVGSYVILNTDEVALVLEHRETNPMRPLLAVVSDRKGRPLAAPRVTDLLLSQQISIRSSVAPPQITP